MKLRTAWPALALIIAAGAAHAACPNTPTINMATDGNGNLCVTGVGGGGASIASQSFTADSTPTVSAAAYTSGNCVGGFTSVTLAASNGGPVDLSAVTLKSLSGASAVSVTLYLFDSAPSGSSTCTDRGTFTQAAADGSKERGVPVVLTLSQPTGGTTVAQRQTFSPPLVMTAGGSSGSGVKTIYYAMVAGAAFTPGSTSDLSLTFEGLH